ncbi:MAG: hypothetical protein ACYS80_17195 [Planctomycetota bacterium]
MLTLKKLLMLAAVLTCTSIGTYAQTVHEFVVDMVADGRTMTLNRVDPTAETPRRGDTFIVKGKLYPGGTVPEGGTPENPLFDIDTLEGAIGQWNCRGTFENDFEDIMAGARIHIMSSVNYLFDNGDSLVSDGPETGPHPVIRPIVGGTAQYIGAQGQVLTEFTGFNQTGSGNFRFTFTVVTPTVLSYLVKDTHAESTASSTKLEVAKRQSAAPVPTDKGAMPLGLFAASKPAISHTPNLFLNGQDLLQIYNHFATRLNPFALSGYFEPVCVLQ